MTPLRWTSLATHVPAGGSLGGVVRYTAELLRALAARDDVEVSALATRAGADTVGEIIGDRRRVTTVPDLGTPALSVVERYLPLAAARTGMDVVHGTKHLLPQRTTALRALTIHDMILIDRAADFGRVKRHLLPPSYRGSIRDADLLLCVSNATRDRLTALEPQVTDRAEVVPLATSPSLRGAVPEPIRRLLDRRFAVVVGDSSPRKNLQTLVAAWPAVRVAVPDAVLAIAGPPSWGRTEVGELYDELVASGAIVALGHVSDAELRWAYEHAAVVACPSLAEGFGLPAAEALDLGAPVMVSDDAALREVSAGAAVAVLPALDVAAWARALAVTLAAPPPHRPRDGRTWADVAADTVAVTREALARRDSARRSA